MLRITRRDHVIYICTQALPLILATGPPGLPVLVVIQCHNVIDSTYHKCTQALIILVCSDENGATKSPTKPKDKRTGTDRGGTYVVNY